MTEITFIRAWPRNPTTGAEQLVRMAGGGARRSYRQGGVQYRAGLVGGPRFSASASFDQTGWTGASVPRAAALDFRPAVDVRDALAELHWPGARIEVDQGDEAANLPRVLTGTVAAMAIVDSALQFTITEIAASLTGPFITATFAGTGGIEGDIEALGRLKRQSYGRVFNVVGQLLDKAYSIYEFGDPSLPIDAFTAVRDKGRAGGLSLLGWQGSIAATLSALRVAVVPQGGAVVAPSICCARWWTQPVGPLTADLRGIIGVGYVETVPALVNAIAARAGGPAVNDLAAAIVARGGPAGIHVAGNETAAQLLDRLTLGVSMLWSCPPAGGIDLLPITFDNPVATLRGEFEGRARSFGPTGTRKVGYMRNERIQGDSEIAADVLASDIAFADGSSLGDLQEAVLEATDKLDGIEPGATVGAPVGTFVGSKLAQQVLAELMAAGVVGLNNEFWIRRRETIDPVTGLVAVTEYANSDGVIVSRSMAAGPDGGVIGYMASEYLFTDNSGGNVRPIMTYDDGRWKIWDAWINKLEIGSVLTGSIAVNAVVDGDTISLASPMTGNGSWQTAFEYDLAIPASVAGELVEWQVVGIVTGSQSFPSGDRTWDTRLVFDVEQKGKAGGQKSEDSLAMSGRVNWGTGTRPIKVEWNGASGCSLAEMNMTLLWFKR